MTTSCSERLAVEIARAIEEGRAAEVKATSLLSALSLPLAVLVAVIPGHPLPSTASTLVGMSALGFVTALLIVLRATRARLGGPSRGSYLHWADSAPEEVLTEVMGQPPCGDAERLIAIARSTRRKHRLVRAANDLASLALLLLAAALLFP
ncbi:hypothetical protein [Streptomyces sp. NPDC048636]|uniref:hypothetical protein n=1 Tax=Streptomyces sp. NPDC048636 TaxID=3155762 RepID=UPI00341C60DF